MKASIKSYIKFAAAAALVAGGMQAAHAVQGLNVAGNLVQTVNANRAIVTSAAVGSGASAAARVGTISGDIQVNGNLTQTVNANRAIVTAAAIGSRATAVSEVGTIHGGKR